jgi:YhcN/YlaJ family sporulation lipoprotein
MRLLLTVMLLIGLLAGCGNTDGNEASPSPENQRKIRAQQTAPEKREIKNNQEVTDRLEKLAESNSQVKSANVVVIGDMAIVGIDVDGNMDRSRVGVLKYSVAEALRKDPYGANAVVTADLDINNRLREIAQDIRNGHPLAGFVNELGDMIGRIMPQLPSDLFPREEQPPNTSNDKKNLKKDSL